MFGPAKVDPVLSRIRFAKSRASSDRLTPLAFRGAIDFLRRGGQVLLVGVITHETPILPMNFTINEWQLQGSYAYYSDEFPMVIAFLKKGVSPVKEMITSKIKLSDIVKEGFDKLLKPGHNEIKILVEPEE